MDVLQLEGRAFEGKKVRFKVQGVESDQYGTWNFGELTNVNLNRDRAAKGLGPVSLGTNSVNYEAECRRNK